MMLSDMLPPTVLYFVENEVNLTLALTVLAVVIALLYHFVNNRGLPPGPSGIPYFGILPFIRNDTAHIKLLDMQKKFGDLFSFRVTGRLFVNMSTAKLTREFQVTKSDCFQTRPTGFSLINYIFGDGVAIKSGEAWKVTRKFFLYHLKERGISSAKDYITETMYDAIKEMVQELHLKKGEPFNILELLTGKCTVILRHSLFGSSEVTEKEVNKINESYAVVTSCLLPVNQLLFGPISKYILCPLFLNYRAILREHKKITQMLTDIIDNHKKTFKDDNIRNIIDSYIKEKRDRRARGDLTAEYFTDELLLGSLYQFIGDGALSVAYFATAFLKFSTGYPEEQQKIYEEIMEVIGPDRTPTLDDKSKLPYTNAFLLETLRCSDFIYFFPALECTRETTVSGYRIPKGTITILNFWTAHKDPRTYEDPETFNPSRFLVKDGKPRPELPINFGMGKRACIGESFTMSQVFLFLTAIIQNFKLTVPDNVPGSTFQVLLTGDVQIRAEPRTHK